MTTLFQIEWIGSHTLTVVLQSADRIVGLPWWQWILLLLVLLVLILVGLLSREDPSFSYPLPSPDLPDEAMDQLSSGTELESAINARKATAERQIPPNT